MRIKVLKVRPTDTNRRITINDMDADVLSALMEYAEAGIRYTRGSQSGELDSDVLHSMKKLQRLAQRIDEVCDDNGPYKPLNKVEINEHEPWVEIP